MKQKRSDIEYLCFNDLFKFIPTQKITIIGKSEEYCCSKARVLDRMQMNMKYSSRDNYFLIISCNILLLNLQCNMSRGVDFILFNLTGSVCYDTTPLVVRNVSTPTLVYRKAII